MILIFFEQVTLRKSLISVYCLPLSNSLYLQGLTNPFTLSAFRQIFKTIPLWAFALVLVILTINTFLLIGRQRMSLGGGTVTWENGHCIHAFVKPGGPVYKAGIRPGDTIVSINSVPIGEWHYSMNVGDTAIAGILRHNKVVSIPVAVVSLHSFAPGFFWSLFIIAILTSISSLYLMYLTFASSVYPACSRVV
jgi:hypothetical protein